MERPNKDEYYLGIAKEVAKRSTCMRRRFGAIIVNNDQVISTGYVGAPRGTKNCIDIGFCPRQKANIPAGERYELCRSVHAEQNAIIHAAREQMIGGTLYLYGENMDGSIVEGKPCKMCTRVIINAGIKKVVTKSSRGVHTHNVDDWVKDEIIEYNKENIKGY